MQLDVDDLQEFYATPLGQTVRRLLTHRIRARWRGLHRSTLIGLGYSSPYLGAFRGEAQHLGALMPDSQGVVRWPREGASQSVLVDDDRLPLADGSVDRLLAVHCLEVAERTRQLLREMWRVLAPEGRMILVVPNRRGVWARLDNTPFGQGRPYSRRQLDQLLVGAMFTPLDWGGALFFPPLGRQVLLRSSTAWERVGASVSPAFCGVLIVEASKELVAPIGKPAKARRLPQLVPSASPARRDRA
ncbi:MAG: class I SAM-dependent methyltransferase [Hyphomicrobium sp.]|nr:class I SAM-dependent methyltransferase [Hyphomicrobium sp.]